MRKAFSFAYSWTNPLSVTVWFAPVGGVLAAGLLYWMGAPVTFGWWLPDNVGLRGAFDLLVCIVVAYIVLFLACLTLAPLHFKLERHGGIRAYFFKKGIRQMWPQYVMVIGGAIVFVGFVGFLQLNVKTHQIPLSPTSPGTASSTVFEPNTDPNALGFFAAAHIRLYDTPELRRKYIFDFLAPTKARMSFYVSPSDLFVFTVADVNNEFYSLEVPISSDAIPLNRYIFLYCEAALDGPSTHLRIVVDGKQVAQRTIGTRIELGKDYWKWKHVTFGADANGHNNAPFKIAMEASGHTPLTDSQLASLKRRFDDFLAGTRSPVQFH